MFFKGKKLYKYSKHTQFTFIYQTKEERDRAANLLGPDVWFDVRPTHSSFNSCEFSFWVYEDIQREVIEIAACRTGAIGIRIQKG